MELSCFAFLYNSANLLKALIESELILPRVIRSLLSSSIGERSGTARARSPSATRLANTPCCLLSEGVRSLTGCCRGFIGIGDGAGADGGTGPGGAGGTTVGVPGVGGSPAGPGTGAPPCAEFNIDKSAAVFAV